MSHYLSNNRLYDMSMDISQAEVASLEFIGQTLVVDPKQMKESGVEIMYMDSIIDHIVTVFIGLSVGISRFYSTPCHP